MDASAAVARPDAGDRWSTADRPRAEFRLLGHLEVGDGDGAQAFGGPKQRALLAFLLLHAGEVVTTERLVDAIWGDEPPPTATAIVYGYVRKLRTALEATSATLSTRSSGYVLDIPGGSLDVARFERLGGLGRQALRAGDVADARRLLAAALGLWRGHALDGLDGDGFIRAEHLRLESLRLATLLGRIDADLRLGGAADVVEELEALARDHPLDEGMRGQLMVALYRTGNQAAALAAYQDVRRALAEELGLDPSRSLQELEGAILRQDPSLDLPGPDAGPRPAPTSLRTAATALRLVDSGDACPFVGLATFGVNDADVFFGRERLVSEMVARLAYHRFLGVIGPSGSGKSSAVRAGLVPAIEAGALGQSTWVRAILRPGAEPMRELDRVVFAALDESQRLRLPAGQDPLTAAASVLPDDTRLLVIVDQFEEVFTSVDDATARSAFIESLTRAARDATAAVVLALRADFYGRCAEEPSLAEMLSASQVLVGPMGRDEYRSVIEGPAAGAGLTVEPALVERLIDEVEGRPGGLPLLSTALVELWERRDARMIPLSALAATGGISGAVGRLAENAYGQLTDAEQATGRIIFLRLVGGEGDAMARRRVALAEFDIATNADMRRTLAVLTAARLLTADRGTIEVAHEALFREWPRLEGWLDEDAQGRRVRAHLTEAAHEWDDSGRNPGELYRGARLASVLDWTGEHGAEVNELERQFVAESKVAGEAEERRQRRANRRLRLLLAGALAALVLAVAAGTIALVQRAQAQQSQVVADAERTVADQERTAADTQTVIAEQAANAADAERLGAQGLTTKALDTALLLARQGVAIDDTPATRANLFAALLRSPDALNVAHPLADRPQRIVASLDGATLAVTDNTVKTAVIDAATGATRYIYPWSIDVYDFVLADDGDGVVLGRGPTLRVLDSMTGQQRRTITYPDGGQTFSFAPDLKTIGRTSADATAITIYDAVSRRPLRTIRAPKGTWIADMLMFDGGYILAPLGDGTPGDWGAVFDHPGVLRVALWGPDDTTPGSTAEVSTTIDRGGVSSIMVLSPDHRTLLLPDAPGQGQGILADLRTGTQLTLQGGIASQILGGAFSPDGSLVETSGDDGVARLWDVKTGALVDTFVGHNGRVWPATFSQANGQLTMHTASLDGSMITWDVTGSRRLGQPFHAGSGFDGLADHVQGGPKVVVSPDGRLLATDDPTGIQILDATTHAVIRRLSSSQPDGSFDAAWSPDGTRLAVAGAGTAMVELYDTETWRPIGADGAALRGPSADRAATSGEIASNPMEPRLLNIARAIAFSPDSQELVAGTDDGSVWTWDARTGEPVGPRVQLTGSILDVAFNPVSRALAVDHVDNEAAGVASVFEPDTRAPLFTVSVDDGFGTPEAVAFSPDGKLLATGGAKGDIRFYDAATGSEVGTRVPASAGWVLDLVWDRSGTMLVSSGTDGTVRLVDVGTHTVANVLPGVDNDWVDAAVSPDGKRLYAVYSNGEGFDWALDPTVWAQRACTVAGRTLTQVEWDQYLPGRPYAPACRP